MRTPSLLALILLSLATPVLAQASGDRPFLGATPVEPGGGDTLARDGIRSARLALEAHQGLVADLRRTATPQERARLQAAIALQAEGALRDLLKRLGPIYRSSQPNRVLIHQLAKDALGDHEGDAAARVAYQVDALRRIAALHP